MNGHWVQAPLWTRRRWITAVGLVFAAHVALAYFLSDRSRESPDAPPVPPFVAVMGALDQGVDSGELPPMPDPTLFALVSPLGFSGSVWMEYPRPRHQFREWQEPTVWLTQIAADLGVGFRRFVETNATATFSINDPLKPYLTPVTLAPGDLPAKSFLEITGDLAARPLALPLELPSIPHPDILTNTVVEVLVTAQGYAVSARLVASCGLRKADELALESTRKARFQPLVTSVRTDATGLVGNEFGYLVFHWHTIPTVPAKNEEL